MPQSLDARLKALEEVLTPKAVAPGEVRRRIVLPSNGRDPQMEERYCDVRYCGDDTLLEPGEPWDDRVRIIRHRPDCGCDGT